MSRTASMTHLQNTAGVYFMSPTLVTSQTLGLIKIGMAKKNLAQRLQQYLICYPNGFYLYGLVYCDPDTVLALETEIHNFLRAKQRGHEFNAEWFYLTLTDLQVLLRIIQVWPDLFTAPSEVIYFQPPYRVRSAPPRKVTVVLPRRSRRLETVVSLDTLPRRSRASPVEPSQIIQLTDEDLDIEEDAVPVKHWQDLFTDRAE